MRTAMLLVALAATWLPATVASADTGSAATNSAPPASAPAVPARTYYRGRQRGLFSGRSAKNWYLNRGTPADNSTIPTPINRNPKGRPQNSPVIFPKNM